jgi:hypothetical protein
VSSGITATTAQAAEIVVGGMTYRNSPQNTITEGAGYDLVQEGEDVTTYPPISVTDKEVSSTGTQETTWTLGGSHRWAAGVATFRRQAAAPSDRKGGVVIFPCKP